LLLRKYFQYKACEAIGELIPVFAAHLSSNMLFNFLSNNSRRGGEEWVRSMFFGMMATQLKGGVRTWQLIREAALKDPEVPVRSRAFGLLLSASNCDEVQRKLIWLNLDEQWRGMCDPKELVTSQRIAYIAEKLGLSIDEVERQYEAIADRLQIELNLEWRKPN
jgi:hypothetical protein